MTSPRHGGRLRMPVDWFDELASGGGSAGAVGFLAGVERTRRMMLLGEVLDRLDEHPDALRGLGSATTAWQLIAEAAEVRPEAAEQLLMSPQIGCWTAHMLRRLHGTEDGPPLWSDAGHLFAIALVARMRAGLDADVVVPVRDGGLSLPTLGLARIGGPPGFGTASARLRGGDLHLTSDSDSDGEGITVRLCDTDGARSAHWTPSRTFAGTSTWLDDLDPYRELGEPVAPQPLGGAEAAYWQRLFSEAASILSPSGSGPGRLRVQDVRRIVPWTGTSAGPDPEDTHLLSATTADAFGSMVISRPADGLDLAEAMVHEFQHSKLGALLLLFPLLDDDDGEIHYAPWRSDPRHATGLLQGAYAFTGVTGFWRDRMTDKTTGETAAPDLAAFHFALRRLQTRLVVRTLLTRAALTGPGTRLLHGLAATLDGWLREDVAPGVAARARAAALSHRVEWRLRNLRCGEAERALLTTAFRAGAAPPSAAAHESVLVRGTSRWSDPRAALYRVPPRAPVSADAHLAAGDPHTALRRYAELLCGAPADPHALSGWLLARAGVSPARRRLPPRPERLLALAPVTPEELRRAADWLGAGPTV
ncbi:HEXXH motif-containing putative peptide modification protein [Streptomyces sp. NBC_00536]|uniref:aKG-HExxH-type peptide beta-hydroxylase n=1 Tax=Streptomyces sp. NBC_00536 TaxID=2975769 RepID=UPI002E80A0F0|nr:HEXXH motif-containing putative peptide modification protein [Streptomyces sp. NBC_00536]WUC77904.1 HEXXH motif-containing putative peptide modification protein [Streptomyces sp. NBC_00536]